ncbi:MAG TPA: YceI family protein [Anaerolineales bacterium]|nr:YceI family protein [Anaerolineales bacterium]
MSRRLLITALTLFLAACGAPAATPDPTLPIALDPTAPAPTAAPETLSTPETQGDDIRAYKIVPDESTASYRVGEVFINENNRYNLAIGATNVVEGEIQLNFTHPEQSTVGVITVDISTLTSDSSRRDNRIRREWLESTKFPIVTFTPTAVTGISPTARPGDDIAFQITGDLLIRETTRPATFEITAKLDGDSLTGTATTTILMTDFNFDPPDIAGMLKAENEAILEFKFVARP